MTTVVHSVEAARGCGYRRPGKSGIGVYLVGPAHGMACARLPLPLHICPTCSAGIKQSRGWTWIDPNALFPPLDTACESGRLLCRTCPVGLGRLQGKHGLLWIGEKFYSTPHLFLAEASKRGISRKLSALPKGFKLGETWVFLAHRRAIVHTDAQPDDNGKLQIQYTPGVFSVFKPAGVDIVIADEHDVPERAIKLAEEIGEGARIVKVERDIDTQQTLFAEMPLAKPEIDP